MPNLTAEQVGGGVSGRYIGANFDVYGISTSDAGREFILSITADAATLTNAKLDQAIAYLTSSNYTSTNTDGSSAGTIAAIGTADGTAYDPTADTVVYVRYQTTESFVITDYNDSQSNTTIAIVCEFKPAK
jgi:hypothetical protein